MRNVRGGAVLLLAGVMLFVLHLATRNAVGGEDWAILLPLSGLVAGAGAFIALIGITQRS